MKVSLSTPFSGIPLWVLLVVVSVSAFIVVTCIILSFCFTCYPRKKQHKPRFSLPKSVACNHYNGEFSSSSLDKRLLSASGNVSEHSMNFEKLSSGYYNHELFIPMGYDIANDRCLEGLGSKGKLCSTVNDKSKGWNFSLKEIEDATNRFAKENEVGSGDNGIVYLGLLPSNRHVAVKKLVCNSLQPEELFASQMEAIECAKHNNLVKLLGYCAEGANRITVSEYVENESLHHWLHEFPAEISSLTWDIRHNIIHGVAKGLAYLHDEVKPKILHGSLKARNILLDHKWNPKISDFGVVEVLSSKRSHIILEVEALGSSYEAPDCPSSSNLTEGNDIYDFGLLIMEIISGRIPSYNNQTQTHIVDWFKSMISNGKIENAIDPKLLKMPSSKALKQVALVALRCVDPDVNPRLKMRDVVSMLETNILLCEERQIAMKTLEGNHSQQNQKKIGDTKM